MKRKRAASFLFACLLWVQCACAQGVFPGEMFFGAGKVWTEYTYSQVSDLASRIQAADTPESIDIRPTLVPLADLIELRSLFPDTTILCTTQIAGVTLDTGSPVVDLSDTTLPPVQELADALQCFPSLTQLLLCKCKNITNEEAASLANLFPHVDVVWTVHFGKWILRTDAQAFSTLNSNDSQRYDSEEYSVLRYCTRLRALDLGHNRITDLSFLTAMPELKILILADNSISDISPLAQCTKLEYVELFMNDIVDFSPLATLTSLRDLNLCHNKAVKADSLAALTQLERLWLSYNREMPKSETQALGEALPNCQCNFTVFYSTQGNWRGHPRYAVVKYIFDHGIYLEWDADVPPIKEQMKNMR